MAERKIDVRVHESLQTIIRASGTLACSLRQDRKNIMDADRHIEQFLREKLRPLVIGARFFGEELGQDEETGSPFCWVIDPIDGTTNFLHGLPYFCVSVALTFQDEPILSAIYAPVLDELFVAEQGHGAFCNKEKLPLHGHIENISQIIAVAGELSRQEIAKLIDSNFVLRRHGAIALDLAYIAAGKIDAGIFLSSRWWDIAAGILLVSEAAMKVKIQEKNKNQYAVCAGESRLVNGISSSFLK
jgi:myo-inositol-1(or 4)-monophosphatase